MKRFQINDAEIGRFICENIKEENKYVVTEGAVLTNHLKNLLIKFNVSEITLGEFAFREKYNERGTENANKLKELLVKVIELEKSFEKLKIVNEKSKQLKVKVKKEKDQTYQYIINYVSKLVDELMYYKTLTVDTATLRKLEDYTFSHSVNVCILSLRIGYALNYDKDKLVKLGVGALLHDIGKNWIPKEIHYKAGKFSKEEYEIMKKHSEIGYKLMKENTSVPITTAHVAYQHHERIDGSGYPRRLCGNEILEFGQIVAVCDVYDAILAKRPYKRSYLPHEAMNIIVEDKGILFNDKVVDRFCLNIFPYEKGAIVELNTGEVACVIENKIEFPDRPLVKKITTSYGLFVDDGDEVDLLSNSNYKIVDLIRS